jgi:hypothetical protein
MSASNKNTDAFVQENERIIIPTPIEDDYNIDFVALFHELQNGDNNDILKIISSSYYFRSLSFPFDACETKCLDYWVYSDYEDGWVSLRYKDLALKSGLYFVKTEEVSNGSIRIEFTELTIQGVRYFQNYDSNTWGQYYEKIDVLESMLDRLYSDICSNSKTNFFDVFSIENKTISKHELRWMLLNDEKRFGIQTGNFWTYMIDNNGLVGIGFLVLRINHGHEYKWLDKSFLDVWKNTGSHVWDHCAMSGRNKTAAFVACAMPINQSIIKETDNIMELINMYADSYKKHFNFYFL